MDYILHPCSPYFKTAPQGRIVLKHHGAVQDLAGALYNVYCTQIDRILRLSV